MGSAGEVQALVTDPKLVEERRGQIVRAAGNGPAKLAPCPADPPAEPKP